MRFLSKAVLLILGLLMAACQSVPAAVENPQAVDADLSGIKSYLIEQSQSLVTATKEIQAQSDRYYALAQSVDFDYVALWETHATEVVEILGGARTAWVVASPLYEKMEGIVAGTPALAEYDVILDAGTSAQDDPENAVPFDLVLPDGRVLTKPGNLFGVTESTLWGTEPNYTVHVAADWNGDGVVEFGETLADANVLKGGVDALESYSEELYNDAADWDPSLADAFTALVVMVPTMNEYFASWRDSRFVAGVESNQRDFVAISRLADIQSILDGLMVVYSQVRPFAEEVDSGQAAQIANDMQNLHRFVGDVHADEESGRRFSAEEADILGAEAQNQATSITGRISQIAELLNIPING